MPRSRRAAEPVINPPGRGSPPQRWDHAIVVGAGIAGLLAARVLADHFRRVTVFEQDLVTADTLYHRGVPQARHPHGLLPKGAAIIEEFFPGLRAELADQGAPVFDLGEAGEWLFPYGWAPRGKVGVTVQTATRAALEQGMRRRVLAHPRVTIRGGTRVEGLCWDQAAGRVNGVRTRDLGSVRDADLVIDASGRTSRTAAWLAEAGYPAPRQREVAAGLSYSTRMYRIPPDVQWDGLSSAEAPAAPDLRRGGVISVVEGSRWLISLIGAAGEVTPAKEEEFLAYARSLRNSRLTACISAATAEGPIYRTAGLGDRWTHFHRMRRWPDRLVCVGDSVCALNPVYGQGMTVAAIQAKMLHTRLRQRRRADLTGAARGMQRRGARIIRLPWLMAVTTDLAWDAENAPIATRLTQWYFRQLLKIMPEEIEIFRRFFQAVEMEKSPAVVLHPSVLGRLVSARTRNLGKDRSARRT